MKRVFGLLIVFTLIVSTAMFVEAGGGGNISGTITAASKVADPMLKIETSKPEEIQLCGSSVPKHEFEISAGLGVKNVIVYVEGVKGGAPAPKQDFQLNNTKCEFTPLVGIAYKGSNFVIKNSDPVFHNTSLGLIMPGGARSTVYNLALPNKDQVISKPIRRGGMHAIKCDAHSWMRAYVYVTDNPYAAITDANGKFEIKDVPPGTYKVVIWHEGFGETTEEVKVGAGATATLNHVFKK